MSGRIKSTGILVNPGDEQMDISSILDLKIKSLDIYSIPLSSGILMDIARGFGKILQPLVHPAISPTFCHIAIKLNLENFEDIILMEYGQYLTEESKKYYDNLNWLFNSSDNRIEYNKVKYYYINEDGVRITKIAKQKDNIVNHHNILSSIYSGTAVSYFGAACSTILNRNFISNLLNEVNIIKCNVKNQITLEELKNQFLGDNWQAKKYNITSHNCQDFGAEVVKILKAERINEEDKIRMNEKYALPNCIIKALTENEEFSSINTIGRIPIVGLLFDIFAAKHLLKNKDIKP